MERVNTWMLQSEKGSTNGSTMLCDDIGGSNIGINYYG